MPLKDLPFIPMPKGLILTHIFLGLLAGRVDTVEAVKQSATASFFQGLFTKSICKMWVKDRPKGQGSSGSGRDIVVYKQLSN